ncbi:RNA 2',3'-cyclic phosphodiesterase [Castellaniella defragrans]|uniref:RNA 2',3'-cyclic phosphodiesterase n=1 Tax=Castellaniella defragrans TaxID=75697 RepID=UPI002AFF0416|nr:RNA 2',3'-cyclic phosphodiesterase [Castellaniella defragrans]
MSGRQIDTRRLFFALWPDAAAVAKLVDWTRLAQEACGGRRMRPDTLHLTLAFLGAVDTHRIQDLIDLLHEPRGPAGTLALDRFGRFRGPRIVWAGPSAQVSWLEALHRSLWRDLDRLGFPRPNEPFRPHVSLLRQAGDGDLAAIPTMRPIVWDARRLVLVASAPREKGSYYEVLGNRI